VTETAGGAERRRLAEADDGIAWRRWGPYVSARQLTLYEVAREISDRLTRIFLRGPDGRRPLYGGQRPYPQTSP
jgi:hypothetical protein